MFRSDSRYDDDPAVQYQFPRQYLTRAQQMVGDWVLYLEPKKVAGTRGYFAIARIQQIIKDPNDEGMHIAIIEPGTYLDFAHPVQFSDANGPMERGLLNDAGNISGRAQAAVRPVSSMDFNSILERGLNEVTAPPRHGEFSRAFEISELIPTLEFESPRERTQRLENRIIRDRVFRSIVLNEYDATCALTGLKLINGGGRAEVEAAHIKPVAGHGPDSISNGIALSGTVHWMFDRGLVSLSDDLEILISRHINDVAGVRGFLHSSLRARAPNRPTARPHPTYLRWHRENCFKG